MSIFDRVPLTKNYKDVHEDSVLLRGPPTVVRSCFILEIAIAAAAFAVSFYLSYTSTVDVTTITYESLGSSYECAILSPRSDSTIYSEKHSELVQFSSARLLYDDCTLLLRKDGLHVCSDENRQDYVLTSQGISANATTCFDLHLENDFKFCFGSEENTQLRSDLLSTFPRQSVEAPPLTYKDTFYFTNESGKVMPNSAPFTGSTAASLYVVDEGYIYAVALDSSEGEAHLYQFSPNFTAAESLMDISGGTVAGLAVGNGLAHVLTIGNNGATLHTYNMTSDATQIRPLDCDSESLDASQKYQFLALGDNDILYVMCSDTIEEDFYTFYSLDTVTYKPVPLYVDAGSVQLVADSDNDDGPLPKAINLATLVSVGNYVYFSSGTPFFNLLQVDLTPQPTSEPTFKPSPQGSLPPSIPPASHAPTRVPTKTPSAEPSRNPSAAPTTKPSVVPSVHPSAMPTYAQTPGPTAAAGDPTSPPTEAPTLDPTEVPTDVPTLSPTIVPTVNPSLQPSPSPTNGGTPGGSPAGSPGGGPGPGPGPGPGRRLQTTTVLKEIDEIMSVASHATKTILVSALTSVLLHVAGFNGTDVAASVHAVVKERTRLTAPDTTLTSALTDISNEAEEDEEEEEENLSYRIARRLDSVPLQPVQNMGQFDGTGFMRTKNKLIYFQDGESYFNTTSGVYEPITTQEVTYYTATAVQVAYSYAVCNNAIKNNFTLNVGTTSAYYYECDNING